MTATQGRHLYSLFGLQIASDLPLPELPAGSGAPTDVEIRLEPPVAEVTEVGFSKTPTGARLGIGDAAAFTIDHGRTIGVAPLSGAPAGNVRLFLLGSAFGVLLHQRGIFPLHANAVELDGQAVAFFGESGAGKSTLAGWFYDQGYRVLADDVCAIRFADDGTPIAYPGIPRLRLWREAVEASGRSLEGFARSFSGDDSYDKFDVPLPAAGQRGIPLAAAYLLGRGDQLRIAPLEGVAAAEALFAHTYRGALVESSGSAQEHWSAVVRLIGRIKLFTIERRWDLGHLRADAGALLEHARSKAALLS
ncbi:hypothetical protein HMF7854_10440 [Sphingomonas ginkgonis]|uniref:Serine kinase n=1 Tax=Sphingomonas ginkgonis TaxID=2315330 RepID=A0A3R9YJA0_9SPHN|nr:hypothetical protein [Sphingomonas ginkgonis]RST31208.1 hypothetical protein HMF7854_10440 [Sphingomonas ginkgonis]